MVIEEIRLPAAFVRYWTSIDYCKTIVNRKRDGYVSSIDLLLKGFCEYLIRSLHKTYVLFFFER